MVQSYRRLFIPVGSLDVASRLIWNIIISPTITILPAFYWNQDNNSIRARLDQYTPELNFETNFNIILTFTTRFSNFFCHGFLSQFYIPTSVPLCLQPLACWDLGSNPTVGTEVCLLWVMCIIWFVISVVSL